MPFQELRSTLELFSPTERNDIAIYIVGIMVFKFGTEAFNGSIIALTTKLFDKQGTVTGGSSSIFQYIGMMQGLNLGMRCFGSILVGPLVNRFPIKVVMGGACAMLALSTGSLMIADSRAGGTFKTHGFEYIGDFDPRILLPIHATCGLGNGMIDLVRAIIPSDLVGGHVEKLQRLDSMVSATS